MDLEDETAKFKIFAVALVVFLLSAYSSYAELKYTIWGQATSASITDVKHVQAMRRSPAHQLVKYSFQEKEGASRTGSFKVAETEHVPADAKIEVQYLAGEGGDSRPKGEKNIGSVIIFLGTLVFLGFSIFQMAREANPNYLRNKQSARRRR